MKIVEPKVEVYFHYPQFSGGSGVHPGSEDHPPTENGSYYEIPGFLEKVGRTCYKSEDRITTDSSHKFVQMLFGSGHHAMLEHCVASVLYVTDRGLSHELVRHRIASFAQESTRYCNYAKEKFDKQISVIKPEEIQGEFVEKAWRQAVETAENAYMDMLAWGVTPQIARSVLPTCLKTELWETANLREWHHIFSLRCSSSAHPQMQRLMKMVLPFFMREVPEMFEELGKEYL